jgi:hypothetical protein
MGDPFMVWKKVGLADSKSFNLHLAEFVTLVSSLSLVSWPFIGWMRRHYLQATSLTRRQNVLRISIRAVAVVKLAYIAWWMHTLMASGGSTLFDSNFDTTLRVVQLIGWVGSLGTILVVYAVINLWRSPGQWWLSRVGNAAIILSALSFSWLLFHWHLLHFSLIY